MLSHPTVQFQVIHACVLTHVSLIAGRRHFLYLRYLKDSSEQVIAFYLQHTVHHFHINRIGKYHFHIHFFIHFCFTKYLCKENAWKARFSVFLSIRAFWVIRSGDIMRFFGGPLQNVRRTSLLGKKVLVRAHFPLSLPLQLEQKDRNLPVCRWQDCPGWCLFALALESHLLHDIKLLPGLCCL